MVYQHKSEAAVLRRIAQPSNNLVYRSIHSSLMILLVLVISIDAHGIEPYLAFSRSLNRIVSSTS